MKRFLTRPVLFLLTISLTFGLVACASDYKVRPLPFKVPSTFENMIVLEGAEIASKAYTDPAESEKAFGFDIIGAGMLPVQVVFDNQGDKSLEINGTQSFLEDADGNLWPVLNQNLAYERATRFTQTNQVFKEGAYRGFLGAVAGSIIGAAVGIVTGDNVGETLGKGAAIGAAAGATIGGISGGNATDAYRTVSEDLREKSLQNKPVPPRSLAHGFLFFPAEAKSARKLRLQLIVRETGDVHVLTMPFLPTSG
jgi:hypothetical protein